MYRFLFEEPKGKTDDGTPLFYVECSGDSGDSKPTTASTGGAICDGSLCFESDTGKYFSWNEDSADWVEMS